MRARKERPSEAMAEAVTEPVIDAGNDALVLASASPRRRDLLETAGFTVEVLPVHLDESPRDGEDGTALALRLACAKAAAGAALRPGRVVLGADTVVLADGVALGKPADRDEARRMLETLSGRWHRVVTGVAVVAADGTLRRAAAGTEVRFADLSAEEIARYVAGPEPYDKAGGYALQGAAGWFVEEVRGSVSNVVGLPLEKVRPLLAKAGWPLPALGAPGGTT